MNDIVDANGNVLVKIEDNKKEEIIYRLEEGIAKQVPDRPQIKSSACQVSETDLIAMTSTSIQCSGNTNAKEHGWIADTASQCDILSIETVNKATDQ